MRPRIDAVLDEQRGRRVADLSALLGDWQARQLNLHDFGLILCCLARTTARLLEQAEGIQTLRQWCTVFAPGCAVEYSGLFGDRENLPALILYDLGQVKYLLVPWDEREERAVVGLTIQDAAPVLARRVPILQFLEEMTHHNHQPPAVVLDFLKLTKNAILSVSPEQSRDAMVAIASYERQIEAIFAAKGLLS